MNIKELIFNNFGLKVTALLLAMIVWVVISGQEHAHREKTFDCNVEFYNAAESIDAIPRPEKVMIKTRGTYKEMKDMSLDKFKIKIDLAGITQPTTLNLLAEDFLEIPTGLKLEEISIRPRMIAVTIKKFISKEVAVKVNYMGKLKKGVKIIDRKVVPEKVRIYGYKSQLASIDTVFTSESIKLGELDRSQEIKLHLQKREEILRFEDTEEITVQIVIENLNHPAPANNKKENETDKAK